MLFTIKAPSDRHIFRGKHIITSSITSFCHASIFKLQPCLYQDFFYGSVFRVHAQCTYFPFLIKQSIAIGKYISGLQTDGNKI